MQPVNISTSDTLQYPLLVCLYKIVFNYQELRNIHDVLFASAIFLGPSFAFINFHRFRYFVENVSRTTRKWFFVQLYNYPTVCQLFVFIHLIDIFYLGASLFIVFSVFHFLHIKRKGAVNQLHAAEVPNMLNYLYCIYDVYIQWHIIFSIYSIFLFVREFIYGPSLYIYIQYKTTVFNEAFILWSMKTSNIQSKEPTTDIMIILNFKQVHFDFFI